MGVLHGRNRGVVGTAEMRAPSGGSVRGKGRLQLGSQPASRYLMVPTTS